MLNQSRRGLSSGLSLIEMFLSLSMGVVLVTGILGFYYASFRHVKKSMEALNLRMEMNVASDFMAKAIKRAAYWHQVDGQMNNPFLSPEVDLSVNPAGDCLLFSYDRNGDGLLSELGASEDDERYAFRLFDQAIQMRRSDLEFSCDAASGWENLTEPNLFQITDLQFTLDPFERISGDQTHHMRAVVFTLTGVSSADASVTETVTRTVRVRNHGVS